MTEADGACSRRIPSSVYLNRGLAALGEALLLVGLGVIAVVVHQWLRAPLHLPGRQGVVWMTLLVLGRRRSAMPWAGTLVGSGAGLCALGSFTDPLTGSVYALTGVLLDWAYGGWSLLRRSAVVLSLTCGFLHALKPLIRYGLTLITGVSHGSLVGGLAYPWTTHVVFGALGAMAGISLVRVLWRDRSSEG